MPALPSFLASDRLLGRALRAPLRSIPAGTVLPVLSGELRGGRWIVGSHVHGCWLGTYEHEKQRAFARHVRPGDTVYDVGAQAGFYTVLASRLVGPRGRVFAFEPLPRNLEYLRRHVALNHCDNATVIAAAVSRGAGEAVFSLHESSAMGSLTDAGAAAVSDGAAALTVRTVGLDELVAAGTVSPPRLVKMDIEGAELDALEGARALLREHRPTLFLATHGREVHEACCRLLRQLGYRLEPMEGPSVECTDELLCRPAPR